MRSFRPEREKEHDYPLYQSVDDARRGSSISTVTVTRDSQEMKDGSLTPSDDGSSLSRPPSNHRYVSLFFTA